MQKTTDRLTSLCAVCENLLIKNSEIVKPHLEIAFGVHPNEFKVWHPLTPPIISSIYYFCWGHNILNKLRAKMRKILPFPFIGLNMPDYSSWLGHWITATGSPGFVIHFNTQMARRQFRDILCALPKEFGNLPEEAKKCASHYQ